jgi:hypothetical protein
MGYGWYDAVIVYGVEEPDEGMMITHEFLGRYGLRQFATSVHKHTACSFVYGEVVSLKEYKSGAPFSAKASVDKFAEEFGFHRPPKFHLAVSGDYQTCQDEYEPEKGEKRKAPPASEDEYSSDEEEESEGDHEEGAEGPTAKKSKSQ